MILSATISLKNQFSGTMNQAAKSMGTFRSRTSETLKPVTTLTSGLKTLGKMSVAPVVKLKDGASAGLGKISSAVDKLKGPLVIGAVLGGAATLAGGAAVGGALKREQQMISMEHFIGIQNKGMDEATVKKEAEQYVGWLKGYAAETPFEGGEIISGGARAIGASGGDIAEAKQLIEIAGDMAALNPEKTFSDAMEALVDLKTGEFERMKEFNEKITQEEVKAAGGIDNIINTRVVAKFKGGTEKLAGSAAGLWASTTGQLGDAVVVAGQGILTGLKPQLEWLSSWMDEYGPSISESAGRIGEGIGRGIEVAGGVIKTMSPAIQTFFDGVIKPGISWIQQQLPVLQSMWETAWPTISSMLETAWGIIKPIFSIIMGYVKILWNLFKLAWPGISKAVQTAWNIIRPILDLLGAALDKVSSAVNWVGDKLGSIGGGGAAAKGHASGLARVPYDNYPAMLHQGETVLTRRDADNYRNNNNNVTVAKLADTIVVREEADIDRITSALARKLAQTSANRGRTVMA